MWYVNDKENRQVGRYVKLVVAVGSLTNRLWRTRNRRRLDRRDDALNVEIISAT
jgi:hypothetical protein